MPARAAQELDRWIASTETMLRVCAPRGWGKTSAVAAWLTERAGPEPVVWVGGSLLFRNWGQVMLAFADGMHDLGLIDATTRQSITDTSQLYVALQRLEAPIILVIDGVDELTPSAQLEVIQREAARFPMLRLIGIGSGGAQAHTSDDLSVPPACIGRRELAWTDRDARAVLGDLALASVPRMRMDDLIRVSGGHPAAIMHYFRRGFDDEHSASPGGWRSRYLLERVSQARDPGGARRTMLALAQFMSLPERWLHLLGVPEASRLLPWLLCEGLIERSVANGLEIVRLSREDRLALAAVEPPAGSAVRAMHARAAEVFSTLGLRAETVHHLATAGRLREAIELMKAPPRRGERTPALYDLRDAVAAIPVSELASDPHVHAIAVVLAHVPPVTDPRERAGLETSLLAIPRDRVGALPPESRAYVAAAAVTVLNGRGRYSEARRFGGALAAELQAMPWPELRTIRRAAAVLWVAQAEAELSSGHVRPAAALAQASLSATDDPGMGFVELHAAAVAAASAAIEGDFGHASALIDRAETNQRRGGWPFSTKLRILGFARVLVASGEVDPAAMRSAAESFGDRRDRADGWWTVAHVARAYAHLFDRQPVRALAEARAVGRFVGAAGVPHIVRGLIAAAMVDALNLLGRPGAAMTVLDDVEETAEHAFCQGARRATSALLLGDARRALSVTDDCMALGAKHVTRTLVPVLLRRAIAQDQLGMTRAADVTFADSLAHLLAMPSRAPFLNLHSERLDPLWHRLERDNPALAEVTQRFRAVPESVPTTQPVPVALSPREVEIVSMLRTGETIAEIADRLFLSSNTVKSHVRSIYRKLDAGNRREALDAADALGIGRGR
ncbi:LuxR C-terminal-related transcriptional regulator [Leifsonia sp. H3M29-4]|uniref:helix-turn-helix transcriptional regulator n=1 Tax=Salinibacterium metalliresistens TaxID=3031321 RepID=UPI0023DCA537|nr:LuxR family transcriptional regulator [Salinibacterium metalliresistens]MDF1478892.1 LuxR C-terminal-related transcriptional regulator [Salinibacterium metalliresistens]